MTEKTEIKQNAKLVVMPFSEQQISDFKEKLDKIEAPSKNTLKDAVNQIRPFIKDKIDKGIDLKVIAPLVLAEINISDELRQKINPETFAKTLGRLLNFKKKFKKVKVDITLENQNNTSSDFESAVKTKIGKKQKTGKVTLKNSQNVSNDEVKADAETAQTVTNKEQKPSPPDISKYAQKARENLTKQGQDSKLDFNLGNDLIGK